MTLQQIYDLAVNLGKKADPRGETEVNRLIGKLKKEYQDLPEKKRTSFDKESLSNPYSDSRILFGNPKTVVNKILVGIDADASEILLADRLNQKGEKIDAVVGHHPIGIALAALNDVMDLQVDSYTEIGVPVNVMDALISQRSEQVKRKIHPSNHNQMVDTARLLNIPLMNLHTTWDNLGDEFIKNYLKNKKFDNVGEVIDLLMEIPEYQEAAKGKNGPEIVSGNSKARVGKIAISFTGGTNPSKEVYQELAKAGVGTIIDMHIPEDALDEVKKLHVNVINAGHMASDSIGANLFLDILEQKGVTIIPCSGLIRVKRKV
jgi:putative NIF3 family GTP cyclohydrolase 1 type 2